MAARRKSKKSKHKTPTSPIEPDFTRRCEVCGDVPILPLTGMCGPCTFGEAATYGGEW